MSTRTQRSVALGASANLSRSAQGTVNRDPGGSLQGTGISFTASDTIADSGNGLAIFTAGRVIEVRGSPDNSRTFRVETSAAGSLTVSPATVTTEAAGPTITIAAVD